MITIFRPNTSNQRFYVSHLFAEKRKRWEQVQGPKGHFLTDKPGVQKITFFLSLVSSEVLVYALLCVNASLPLKRVSFRIKYKINWNFPPPQQTYLSSLMVDFWETHIYITWMLMKFWCVYFCL